jgi:penicillin amidase
MSLAARIVKWIGRTSRFGPAGWGTWICLTVLSCAAGGEDYLPTADTQVIIDSLGVPHIYADNDADLIFASGNVLARMRLFQIDLVRRQALGRRAEVLGAGSLPDDLGARTMNFLALGRKNRARFEMEQPQEVVLLRAFVSGINRHIEQVRSGAAPLPAPFRELGYLPEPWSVDDTFAIGKMLSFGMSSTLDYEVLASVLTRLAPRLAQDLPLSMPVRPAFILPEELRPPLRSGMGGHEGRPPDRLPPLSGPARAEALRALVRYRRLFPATGSNNWAVSGRFTVSGKPLLAGDPHQPLGVPSRFFAQHLDSQSRGGTFDLIGFGFAGAPGVQLGHNRHVAWTATTNFADVMDLWDVALTAGRRAILLGGVARPVQPRTERIRVRGEGQQVGEATESEHRILDVPGVGVLLPEELLPLPKAFIAAGEVLVMWTGFEASNEAATYLGLGRARSIDEWDEAARRLEVGAVNLIGADQKTIRYRVHARVPDRGDPAARPLPFRILDGGDPRTLWTGAMLQEALLPHATEPARGYLASANNDPYGFTATGHPERAPFYYGYFYDPGDRAARIESQLQALLARGQVREEDLVALQNDAYMVMADDLLPPLAEALAALPGDPELAEFRGRPELPALVGRLLAWDRQMRRDSPDAVVFFAWAHFAVRRGLQRDLGAVLDALFQAEPSYALKALRLVLLDRFPGASSYLAAHRRVVLLGALSDTVGWLKGRFGGIEPTRYAWKDVHGARFAHPLGGAHDLGTFPVDGSIGTVNVSSATLFDERGAPRAAWSSTDGPIYRMVVGFAADGTPRARVNYPAGNDEDPQSPHHHDQLAAWLDGRPAPLPFRRADVEAAVSRRFVVPRVE